MEITICPYLDGKCGTHAQCTKCKSGGAKPPQKGIENKMKHIATEYGQPCNLLELTPEEYESLDGFLRGVGVRSRITKSYNGIVTIQAENPYMYDLNACARVNPLASLFLKRAENEMTDKAIALYKR